jgi:S-formylglutathione hydrolase FrmB
MSAVRGMRSAGALAALAIWAAAALPAPAGPPSCSEGTIAPVVGAVASASCASAALGGVTPFSYYVPPACVAPARCPVLYLLHGFGGDHASMVGTADRPSAFVRALAADPVTGRDLPDIPFILVSPHGRTVPSARPGAPPPGLESFWVDWNPRRHRSPPRFAEHVAFELVGLVDRSFVTFPTREGRAILGVSLGGFGSFSLALQHPDRFASAGSISGALNVLVAPALQPAGAGPLGAGGPPVALPHVALPSLVPTPPGFPFGDPFGAFGDPVADEAFYRGANPVDLAMNGTGLHLRFFHNDAVPRDARDIRDPGSFLGAELLEAIVFPMNLEMYLALRQHGIAHDYELHPGLHSGRYWDPYIRRQIEEQYAHVSHPDAPLPPRTPVSFDYRSIRPRFAVWGWRVSVDRPTVEFLTLYDVSRGGLTLVGSGRVRVELPPDVHARAAAVVGGRGPALVERDAGGRVVAVTVDLGPSFPLDERLGASGIPAVARAARIVLAA